MHGTCHELDMSLYDLKENIEMCDNQMFFNNTCFIGFNLDWFCETFDVWKTRRLETTDFDQSLFKITEGKQIIPATFRKQSDMRQLKEMIASDLSQYMLEMMPSLNDCVDWVCDRFALDATDELIDFVVDCHNEFFGNW